VCLLRGRPCFPRGGYTRPPRWLTHRAVSLQIANVALPQFTRHFAVCHKDATRYTWFGVYFVIPLLKDQERVLVTMTSLKLDLQASVSVRDGVVKDTHVYLQAANQVPPALQCCPAFQRILVSGLWKLNLLLHLPAMLCICHIPVALARDRHCLPSQSHCFIIFSCIDKASHPA